MKLMIGRRIRRLRERNGYTREKLGEICALSPRFLANIELGDSALSLDSLMRLCSALSCSSDDILFGEGPPTEDWAVEIAKLRQIDIRYAPQVNVILSALQEMTTV